MTEPHFITIPSEGNPSGGTACTMEVYHLLENEKTAREAYGKTREKDFFAKVSEMNAVLHGIAPHLTPDIGTTFSMRNESWTKEIIEAVVLGYENLRYKVTIDERSSMFYVTILSPLPPLPCPECRKRRRKRESDEDEDKDGDENENGEGDEDEDGDGEGEK